MRTGAVVFLLLLIAGPVRAAAPPPGLEALYEFAPAPGVAIPFAEEKRHSAMRLTALGFGGARRSCTPELGNRRHAGAVVGTALRHLSVQ